MILNAKTPTLIDLQSYEENRRFRVFSANLRVLFKLSQWKQHNASFPGILWGNVVRFYCTTNLNDSGSVQFCKQHYNRKIHMGFAQNDIPSETYPQ